MIWRIRFWFLHLTDKLLPGPLFPRFSDGDIICIENVGSDGEELYQQSYEEYKLNRGTNDYLAAIRLLWLMQLDPFRISPDVIEFARNGLRDDEKARSSCIKRMLACYSFISKLPLKDGNKKNTATETAQALSLFAS